MNKFLSRLTSMERRFLVGVVVVVILVLNLLFIWPHFGDWSKTKKRLAGAEKTLATFQAEIQQMSNYQAQVKNMESEGEAVQPEDQAIEFMRTINAQALQNGVSVLGSARQIGRTNQFFTEQAQSVTVQSGEKQLVDFLYSLSSRSSMIRVRDLSVRPDQPRQQLAANIKFVASYQKSTAARRVAPAAKSATPVKAAAPTNAATTAKSAIPSKPLSAPDRKLVGSNTAPNKTSLPSTAAGTTKSATPSKNTKTTEKRP
jgi:Tfp pilus assembly protein PilO